MSKITKEMVDLADNEVGIWAYGNGGEKVNSEQNKDIEELTFEFEPEFDILDDEWLDMEDQILEETAKKFGNEYEAYTYHFEAKMVVSARKKVDTTTTPL